MVNGYSVTDCGGQDEKHGEYACTNDKSPTAKYKGQKWFESEQIGTVDRFF